MKIHTELKSKKIRVKIVEHNDQIPHLLYGNVVNARARDEFANNFFTKKSKQELNSWELLAKLFNKRIKSLNIK